MHTLENLAHHIQSSLSSQYHITCCLENGELSMETCPEYIDKVLTFLKRDSLCRFNQLVDICGVDYPKRIKRFDVVYHLLSLELNQRLRLTCQLGENDIISSVGSVYRSAHWYEREMWDMYGIQFFHHPDLRRILTDYGFEGHPLRKDFPLSGFTETVYDSDLKRIKYKPVHLEQGYRDFRRFLSPHITDNHEKKNLPD